MSDLGFCANSAVVLCTDVRHIDRICIASSARLSVALFGRHYLEDKSFEWIYVASAERYFQALLPMSTPGLDLTQASL